MVILASASPQRRALLQQIGIEPVVIPANIDESLYGDCISHALKNLAEHKAKAALLKITGEQQTDRAAELQVSRQNSAWIIAADTVILLGDEVLGKPKSKDDAARMLESLSGKAHQVMTGVFAGIIGTDRQGASVVLENTADFSQTSVTIKSLSNSEISWYISTDEWQNAAGAYRIQGKGACLTTSISGSFSNVVGLPLELIYGMLVQLGYVM